MEEIVNQVAQRAGISQEQAQTAVETVAEIVKQRLPEPMAGQVDKVIAGEQPDLGGFGGMFGG